MYYRSCSSSCSTLLYTIYCSAVEVRCRINWHCKLVISLVSKILFQTKYSNTSLLFSIHSISSAQHFRGRPSSWHSHFRCLLCRCRHVPFSLHFHMYLLHPLHVYSHDDGLLLCLVCLVQGNKLIQYGTERASGQDVFGMLLCSERRQFCQICL